MDQLEFQVIRELSVGITCLREGITYISLSCISVADMKDKANGWRVWMEGRAYIHWPTDSLIML